MQDTVVVGTVVVVGGSGWYDQQQRTGLPEPGRRTAFPVQQPDPEHQQDIESGGRLQETIRFN